MRIRKELWFGFALMGVIVTTVVVFTPWGHLTNGHLGLLMLALIVVAIMLGFPTAFTLMGMGVFFAWLAYRSVNPDLAVRQVLDLMVQRAYAVMSNDVLIAIPLFVFMGYLVERAALIDRLFKSLHLAMARVPGSLAVASIITCAVFATATGIVGAVVTLMGLLAFPAMLRAGYNIKVSAGAITAGGCLGILIPPSVLLIVYGATAGVSVVQLYAGAFFPGFMLAALYLGYVIVLAKLKPSLMPPLPQSERAVPLPPLAQSLAQQGRNALVGLARGLGGAPGVRRGGVAAQLFVTLLPALVIAGALVLTYRAATASAGRREYGRPRRGRRRGRRRRQGGDDRPRRRAVRGNLDRTRRTAGRGEGQRAAGRRASAEDEGGEAARRQPRRCEGGRGEGAGAGRRDRALAGARMVLDRARDRRGGALRPLCVVDLGAARGLQVPARLVLPARDPDHRGARLDRVRPGDADGSGGGRRVRRGHPRRRVSLHRALARARRQGQPGRDDGQGART